MRNRLNQFGMFVEHLKLSVLEEKNIVLNEKIVEGIPCINTESESLEITIKLYKVIRLSTILL